MKNNCRLEWQHLAHLTLSLLECKIKMRNKYRLQNEELVQAGMATFGPFNSFLASGGVCHLLITFANSFGPRSGQAEHWSRSDQNC